MQVSSSPTKTIGYHIVVSLLGPIISGQYSVGDCVIDVSYPEFLIIPPRGPVPLPSGMSTMFKVSWGDKSGEDLRKLESKTSVRLEPFYFALAQINELLIAFKLVRIGHINGLEVRMVGEADCLFYAAFVDGVQTGGVNTKLRTHLGSNRWGFANAEHPEDPLEQRSSRRRISASQRSLLPEGSHAVSTSSSTATIMKLWWSLLLSWTTKFNWR